MATGVSPVTQRFGGGDLVNGDERDPVARSGRGTPHDSCPRGVLLRMTAM